MRFRNVVVALLLLGAMPSAKAQDASPTAHDFVLKAFMLLKFDVQIISKPYIASSNDDLKVFAQKMIADNRKALTKLVAIARSHRIKIKGVLEDRQRAAFMRMTNMSGADFDKAFAEQQVAVFDEAVQAFGSYAQAGIPISRPTPPRFCRHCKRTRSAPRDFSTAAHDHPPRYLSFKT